MIKHGGRGQDRVKNRQTYTMFHLELELGAAAELGHDGHQRLVNAGLRQLVAVTLPTFLQPLEAAFAHGEQRQGHGQVAPLPLRPGEGSTRV